MDRHKRQHYHRSLAERAEDYAAMLVFAIAYGVHFPAIRTMRAKYVPEVTCFAITIYFRVPLIVFALVSFRQIYISLRKIIAVYVNQRYTVQLSLLHDVRVNNLFADGKYFHIRHRSDMDLKIQASGTNLDHYLDRLHPLRPPSPPHYYPHRNLYYLQVYILIHPNHILMGIDNVYSIKDLR